MPKKFICRASFRTEQQQEKEGEGENRRKKRACKGFTSVLYWRSSKMEETIQEGKQKRIQKRKLLPAGYLCDWCGTFMTLREYRELEPQVKAMAESLEAEEQRRQDKEFIGYVRYYIQEKARLERMIETGKKEPTPWNREGIMTAEEIDIAKQDLRLYADPRYRAYQYTTVEARDRAEELIAKHQFKEEELSADSWSWSYPDTEKMQYLEKLKHNLSIMRQEQEQSNSHNEY